jgi:hypothetical protein
MRINSRIEWAMTVLYSCWLLVASGQDFDTHTGTLEVEIADGGESGVEGQSPLPLDVDGDSWAELDAARNRSDLTQVILPVVEDGGREKAERACWPLKSAFL